MLIDASAFALLRPSHQRSSATIDNRRVSGHRSAVEGSALVLDLIGATVAKRAAGRADEIWNIPAPWAPVFELTASTRQEKVYEERAVARYEDVFESRDVKIERSLYSERDVYEDREITEVRDLVEQRDVFEERDVFEMQERFEERDIYEARDILGTRPIYEIRAVYEDRARYGTQVTGSRSLSGFASIASAGIDVGADFELALQGQSAARIKFASSTKISLTINGTTQNFSFGASDGSFRTALISALNSIDGLSSSYTSNGNLALSTSGTASLTISDVANGLLDFSASPLSQLGLVAGKTNASVTGYDRVQTGTEQVQVGSEMIVIGTEQVKVGSELVSAGIETVKIGTEMVKTGSESIIVGTEEVQVGTERLKVGTESYISGTELVTVANERVKIGQKKVAVGTELVAIGERTVVEGFDFNLVSLKRIEGLAQISRPVSRTGVYGVSGASYASTLFPLLGSIDKAATGAGTSASVLSAYSDNRSDDDSKRRVWSDNDEKARRTVIARSDTAGPVRRLGLALDQDN